MMDKLKKIRAEIFYTRYPMPNYRKVAIAIHVSKRWDKEETENRIINTVQSYNSEIKRETVKDVNYQEVKEWLYQL